MEKERDVVFCRVWDRLRGRCKDAFLVKTKCRGPKGGAYIANFLDLRGDWQLGPHRYSGKASIINGYGL